MKIIAFFLCFCLLISACKNVPPVNLNEVGNEVEAPKDYTIDIDNNGQDDFEINYKELQTLDLPPSGGGINGEMRFINNGAFFCKIYGAYSECLFLSKGDSIKTDLATNNWNYYPVNLISIGWRNGKWDKNWFVNASVSSDYYLGFKLQDKLGYMKLDLNTETGKITVLDSKMTNDTFLIIP